MAQVFPFDSEAKMSEIVASWPRSKCFGTTAEAKGCEDLELDQHNILGQDSFMLEWF